MKKTIDRLRRCGIPAQDMVVVGSCREVFRAMGRGDVLVVCSLCRLADGRRALREGLERVRRAGGIVDSLEEPWWDMRDGQLCWERIGGLYPLSGGHSVSCPGLQEGNT